MTALSRFIFNPKDRNLFNDQSMILSALLQTPPFPALQRTIVTFFGLIFDWLIFNPIHIQTVISHVTSSLQIAEWDSIYPMRLQEDVSV